MEKSFSKSLLTNILGMLFLLSGCLPADIPSMRQGNSVGDGETPCVGSECPDYVEPAPTLPPKVEVRHLIEPNLKNDPTYSTGVGTSGAGSYQRKITIPKTFGGRIYISGINIGTLKNRHIQVRFKFGYNEDSITLPAAVSSAPGITPDADTSVLIVNLNTKPFRKLRLLYDLYDYNKYPLNADGVTLASGAEAVQNNRNIGLYCRGLKLQHDPTFDGVGACDQDSESCLYTYAKVVDQGLIEKKESGVWLPLNPDFPQISSATSVEYFQDLMGFKLRKPLPDTGVFDAAHNFKPFLFSSLGGSSEAVTISGWGEHLIAGRNFIYRGPYGLVNTNQWEMKYGVNNLTGENKLFRQNSWMKYDSASLGPLPNDPGYPELQNKIYFNSYMFPIATQLSLGANVEHLASNEPQGIRGAEVLGVAGKTKWVDGSNARVQSINADGEHIGACNVVSTIEIIAKDDKGLDYIVARTNEVKLQIVRDTLMEEETNQDLLSSNFKACATNANCGGSDCCFNNRCWGEDLVSQCIDPNASQGSKPNGGVCTSDLECSSLCCNQSTGRCSPHNTNKTPPVLCGKYEGQYCIAKEWCRKTPIRKCIIVKNGTTPTGDPKCRLHCYNVEEHGDCINGSCQSPYQEPTPPFNPNDPNECANAVDPPAF